ncbi:MAG: ribbon-helix-helix protein, CopG family [Dermatophilaceae bacterium]
MADGIRWTDSSARHDINQLEGTTVTKRRNIAPGRGTRTEADSPVEAYARALIHRGRPSLSAPGVHSKARQVRLPDTLDARLEQYVAITHTSRSEVMRIALEEYLEGPRLPVR